MRKIVKAVGFDDNFNATFTTSIRHDDGTIHKIESTHVQDFSEKYDASERLMMMQINADLAKHGMPPMTEEETDFAVMYKLKRMDENLTVQDLTRLAGFSVDKQTKIIYHDDLTQKQD